MSLIIIPEFVNSSEFEKMLSMRVEELLAIRVGLLIRGTNDLASIISQKL